MSFAWGIPYLLIRVAVTEMPPAVLVFARTALAAGILLPIAVARVDLRAVLRHWRWLTAFAVIEIVIPWILLSDAETKISSSLAGLLIAGVPLVGAAVSVAIGGERIGGRRLVGLLIGFAGVAVIAGGDFRASNAVAILQMVVVVVCYASGPFILSRALLGVSSLGIMAVSLAMAAVIYAPLAALSWPVAAPSGEAAVAIVILAVVCTAAAFLLFAELIKEVGTLRTQVITYVNPAVAAVLGVVLLHETLTLPMLAGFALVIAGSVLATRRSAPGSSATSAASATPAST